MLLTCMTATSQQCVITQLEVILVSVSKVLQEMVNNAQVITLNCCALSIVQAALSCNMFTVRVINMCKKYLGRCMPRRG